MMAWITTKFRAQNPKLTSAIYAAINEAVDLIGADRQAAADTYLRMTGDKIDPAKLVAILSDPDVRFTMVPENVMKQANFMADIGMIRNRPASWKDLFFPEALNLAGS